MTDLIVQKADGTGDSLTISYCPLSYAYSAVSKNAASADVSKALYNYHVAAKAYFA